MTKPPPMPEFDVPIAAPPDGRLTTVWWEWLQRYVRWDETASGPEGPPGPEGPEGPAGPTGPTGQAGDLSQATADARYVNVAGDTMTGVLSIFAGSFFQSLSATIGGSFRLTKPASGSTLAGDVTFDVTANTLRVYENGGASRGFSVDLAGCGSQSALWHAANFNPALKANLASPVFTGTVETNGELKAVGGVVRLSADNTKYVWWDGTNYQLGGHGVVWTAGNLNPAAYALLSGASFGGAVLVAGGLYNAGAPTTAGVANAHISNADGNHFYRNNSSERYKTDVETLAPEYGDKVLALRPVFYRSTEDTADDPEWSWFGFISEEVDKIDFRFCGYTVAEPVPEGEKWTKQPLVPDHIHTTGILAALVDLVQRQEMRIAALEAAIKG